MPVDIPDIPQKTIRHYAKENGYDVDRTANHLLNIVTELAQLNIAANGDDGSNDDEQLLDGQQQDKVTAAHTTFIIPSRKPRAISEQAQRCFTPPAASLIPDYNYQQKTATVEEIAQIQSELDRMERERRHYIEMGKKNSGSRNGTLCGHYMRRAREVARELMRLEQLCDRQRVWTAHNEVVVDLHGMGFERALELIKYKIDVCREKHPNFRKLHVITGHGKTVGQPSVIRGRLKTFLKQKGIDFVIQTNNPGVIQIRLGSVHQRLTGE